MEQLKNNLKDTVTSCFSNYYGHHIETVPQNDLPDHFCIHVQLPTKNNDVIRVIIPNQKLLDKNINDELKSFINKNIDKTIQEYGQLESTPKGHCAWIL